jgi:hypothetical protein
MCKYILPPGINPIAVDKYIKDTAAENHLFPSTLKIELFFLELIKHNPKKI